MPIARPARWWKPSCRWRYRCGGSTHGSERSAAAVPGRHRPVHFDCELCACCGGHARPSAAGRPRNASAAAAPANDASRGACWASQRRPATGEPVNVLLLVEETPSRRASRRSPSRRWSTIASSLSTVKDTTRALGESGLLSMAFPVKPTSARAVRPHAHLAAADARSRAPADVDWQPVIRGAYLNAAWASAAETLTREPLGSSDGRPNLTLRVARPPLLQDTLELRVREPLDEEERKACCCDTGRPRSRSVKFESTDLPGDWVLWRQVPDPGRLRARRTACTRSTKRSARSAFGDGSHGMIPPIGRDADRRVQVPAHRTRRATAAIGAGQPGRRAHRAQPCHARGKRRSRIRRRPGGRRRAAGEH